VVSSNPTEMTRGTDLTRRKESSGGNEKNNQKELDQELTSEASAKC